MEECLDIIVMWFRDILFMKVLAQNDNLIFKEYSSVLKKQSEMLTLEGIEDIFKYIDQTKIRIKANVNFDTSLELLLIEIKSKFIAVQS